MILEFNPETEQGRKEIELEYQKQFGEKAPSQGMFSDSKWLILYGSIAVLIVVATLLFQFKWK